MSDNIYLIGNKEDYSVFESNANNIDVLPIKNLPMSYFPFFYNNSEMSLDKLKQIVPLVENYTETNDENSSKHTVDTEKLFGLLTKLEEPYQPFNNNNIQHIRTFITIVWILIGFLLLKLLNSLFKDKYIYFILVMVLILLFMSTMWALAVTTRSL